MSTDIPASARAPIEIVSRADAAADDDLWGEVPRDQRLAWLRAVQHSWPFFPGATVGGLTARDLSEGHLVHSVSLIRVARNAFEAGFAPDEYAELRRLLRGGAPDQLVIGRDHRPEHAAHFFEIDANQWIGWYERVRAGASAEDALRCFLASQDERTRADGFGKGPSASGGWGIPFRRRRPGGVDWYPWDRVFEVFPPVRTVHRTSTGRFVSDKEGEAWVAARDAIAIGLEAVGFTPQDLYVLYLTLHRLTEDQWARVDKRLFVGDGVHTREHWMLAPVPEMWSAWPQFVHEQGMLPHEATDCILDGTRSVWDRTPNRGF